MKILCRNSLLDDLARQKGQRFESLYILRQLFYNPSTYKDEFLTRQSTLIATTIHF